jgi:hypothetical protein
VVVGAAVFTAPRTSWSLRTLQEQTIIDGSNLCGEPQNDDFAKDFLAKSQNESHLQIVLNYWNQTVLGRGLISAQP